jgi:hypothetical protein
MTAQMATEAASNPGILIPYTQLKELICAGLDLQQLPNLPPTLEKLNCSENALTALPPLPPALVEINCTMNRLTELPPLPQTLRVLDFTDNSAIAQFPASLPPALETISAFSNRIQRLPPLPATLKSLAMGSCRISELPPLPEGLRELNVTNNKLTALPHLPDSLEDIYISLNNIREIPNIPTNAVKLSCEDTGLTALPQLDHATNLTNIFCINNQITAFPPLPDSLNWLFCSHNKLTELPALPVALIGLYCDYNQLVALPTPVPPNIDTLICNNNRLTSLPPMPTTLRKFDCNRNPLQTPPQSVTGEYLNLKFDLDIPEKKLKFENENVAVSATAKLALPPYDVPAPNVYSAQVAPNQRLVVFDDCFACDRQQKWLAAAEMKHSKGMGCSINSMRFMNLFDETEQQRLMDAANGHVTPFSRVIEYTKKHTGAGRNIVEKRFDVTTLAATRALFANLQKWMPANSCTIFRYSNTSEVDNHGNTFGHTVVLNKDSEGVLHVVDPVQNKMVRHNSDKLFNSLSAHHYDYLSLMFEVVVPGVGGRRLRQRGRRGTRRRRRGRSRRRQNCTRRKSRKNI